jgi:hypothetical protein
LQLKRRTLDGKIQPLRKHRASHAKPSVTIPTVPDPAILAQERSAGRVSVRLQTLGGLPLLYLLGAWFYDLSQQPRARVLPLPSSAVTVGLILLPFALICYGAGYVILLSRWKRGTTPLSRLERCLLYAPLVAPTAIIAVLVTLAWLR